MNLLITGGCGFIGTNLVRHAVCDCGHRVTVVDALTYAGNRYSLADLEGRDDYELVVADICDRVVVMQNGRLVEEGPVRTILRSPQDAYTKVLLASMLENKPPMTPLLTEEKLSPLLAEDELRLAEETLETTS